MSRCIYKDIANNLNKEEFKEYYLTHKNEDVCEYFNFHPRYLFRILNYFDIERCSHEKLVNISKLTCTPERNKKISLSNMGRKFSDETVEKIRKSQKGKVITYGDKISETLRKKYADGDIVNWNKGLKGATHWSEKQRNKYNKTMRDRGWFNKSKVEDELYEKLCNEYGEENVMRQYRDEIRYPFNCDFYIKSEDKFIELNRFWHHGPHKFDSENEEDIELLNTWKEKAKYSKQFENAIQTWTVRDVEKFRIAEENNLNYEAIY